MRTRWMATTLAATALIAGCGGDDSDGGDDESRARAETAETTATPEPAAESLWITASDSGTVYRVNPVTGNVDAAIKVGSYPADVAVGDDAVWVANAESGDVSRIDPATNKVTATLETEDARSVAVGDDQVWVGRISTDPPSVVPIGADDNALGEPIETGDERQPESLIYEDGTLFAEESYGGGVLRIDTESGDVEHLDLDQVVTDLELHEGRVYAAGLGSVFEIDTRRMRVAEEHEADEGRPWALAADADADALWVALQSPTIRRLDLDGGGFAAQKGDLDTQSQPYDVALAEGSVWVVDEGGTLHQIDPSSFAVRKTIELPGASGAASMTVG